MLPIQIMLTQSVVIKLKKKPHLYVYASREMPLNNKYMF